MNDKSTTTLTISAVAFIASLLADLYLIIAYPEKLALIITVSLIVVVDTFFFVKSVLDKVDQITTLNLDKQNELTKVEKGIYSVAKREEVARTQSMSAVLELIGDLKSENAELLKNLINQEELLAKLNIKKGMDNTTSIVESNEKIAKAIAEMALANSKSEEESIEILNDICRELELQNAALEEKNNEKDRSHLRVMSN